MTTKLILNGFRGALVGLRWLFVIGAVISQVRFFTGPADMNVAIFAAPESGAVKALLSDGTSITSDAARLNLMIPVRADETELRKLAYFATMPRVLLIAAAGFIACQLMLRLLDNIRRGELFAQVNGRLLWGLAIVLVASPILQTIAFDGGKQPLAHYLAAHVHVVGWRTLPQLDSVALRELSVNTHGWEVTIIGLLLLVLVQAFREGAALKREIDLTV